MVCQASFAAVLMSFRIFLASESPRRFELLTALGVPFVVAQSLAQEPSPTPSDGRDPAGFVERLARLKAQGCEADGIIIAADTIVWLDGEILGKPKDEVEAQAMLSKLRGRTHRVFTGICVREGDECRVDFEQTAVTFGDFSDEFIAAYIQTDEPMDKAGAYAAQGRGALLIEKIEGDYWNVVGLPLRRLAKMLAARGVKIENFWGAP